MITKSNRHLGRSQWPRGLRHGLAAPRFLELLVWFPRGHGFLSLVSVVCCQIEVSASGWSLVQRSPTNCNASECGRESSIMRRLWPPGNVAPWNNRHLINKLCRITCSLFHLLLVAKRKQPVFVLQDWHRMCLLMLSLFPISVEPKVTMLLVCGRPI
jgi:hypothetical protein